MTLVFVHIGRAGAHLRPEPSLSNYMSQIAGWPAFRTHSTGARPHWNGRKRVIRQTRLVRRKEWPVGRIAAGGIVTTVTT